MQRYSGENRGNSRIARRHYLLGRAAFEDPPVVEHDQPVGDLGGENRIVSNDDYRSSVLFEVTHEIKHVVGDLVMDT